jgi:hypothetical protein
VSGGLSAGQQVIAAGRSIDVRMFNPFASRTGSASFALEALGSANRINRRMHTT